MNFIFTSKDQGSVKFSVDAEVNNMYTTVINIENYGNDVVYVLSVDGQVEGVVSLFEGGIEVADIVGDIGGFAYISTTTLGIKEFAFEVDEQVVQIYVYITGKLVVGRTGVMLETMMNQNGSGET